MLKVAIVFEPPAGQSAADIKDIEAQCHFLEKYLPYISTVRPYRGDKAAFLRSLEGAALAWNLFETFDGKEELQHLGAELLESVWLAYTGSKFSALKRASDKRKVKELLCSAGLPTPPIFSKTSFTAGYWIVKPALLHGSVGITDASVVYAETPADLETVFPGETFFAETYIDGDEYAVSLLDMGDGLKALAVAQMRFIDYPEGKPKILNYDSKWAEESADYKKSVRDFSVDSELASELGKIAEAAASAIGLEGFARIDFRVDKATKPWIIDVNPNPGLGEDAGFIAATRHAGLSVEKALGLIIQAALHK